MPQIFKALATINAWAMFIVGWFALISGYIRLLGAYTGVDLTPVGVPSAEVSLAFGWVGLFLSAAIMKLRHMLQ